MDPAPQSRIQTEPSIRGPVITLAASGIDADAAISALTVATMEGRIEQDVADLVAAAVRLQDRGVVVTDRGVRALGSNAVSRIFGASIAAAPARPMTGAELLDLLAEVRLRAATEGMYAYDAAAIEQIIQSCIDGATWPPFAQWALQSVTMHLAPTVAR